MYRPKCCLALVLILSSFTFSKAQDQRVPVPPEEGVRRARSRLWVSYNGELRAFGPTPMWNRAKRTKDDTWRYAAFELALDYAIKSEQIDTAMGIVGNLVSDFAVDEWTEKTKTIGRLSRTLRNFRDRAKLARLAYESGLEARDAKQYRAADLLAEKAEDLARATKQLDLQERAKQLTEQVERLQEEAGRDDNDQRESGLVATFFADTSLNKKVATEIHEQVDWWWGHAAPHPAVGVDGFSIRWEGFIKAPIPGKYTIIAEVDDGVRLFLSEKRILDEWKGFFGRHEVSAQLTGEAQPIRIEYLELAGGASMSLRWRRPDGVLELVPGSVLSHNSVEASIKRTAMGGIAPWSEGNYFQEIAGDGHLTGLVVWVKGHSVEGVQPIFDTAGRTKLGKVQGHKSGVVTELVARNGYAVDAVRTVGREHLEGLQLRFAALKEGHLDAEDSYSTDWYGRSGHFAATRLLGNRGRVIGIHGQVRSSVTALGLVLSAD